MKHRIIWSAGAKADLLNILDDVQKDGLSVALNLVRFIRSEANRLKQFPFSGRIVPEHFGEIGELRELMVSRCRLIYAVQSAQVAVFAVVDQSQDLETQFLKRLKS